MTSAWRRFGAALFSLACGVLLAGCGTGAGGATSSGAVTTTAQTSVGSAVEVAAVAVAASSLVTIRGRVTFERVPLSTVPGGGLDYYAARWEPARGITVQAVRVEDAAVLGVASTDDDGGYALSVPMDTQIVIRAVASLTRKWPQPLPHYQFFVDDGVNVHTFDSRVFDSTRAEVAQDLAIPSGFDAVTRQAWALALRHPSPFSIPSMLA